MIEARARQITREDLWKLFGNMTEEQSDAKLEEANGIIRKFGIYPESFLVRAHDCKSDRELNGSVYLAKAIKDFVKQ